MDILLLSVKSTEMTDAEEIGICYIAAHMRQKGHNVLLRSARESKIDYEEIRNFKPQIIGLPVYSVSKAAVYRVIAQLKKILDGTFFCVGGIESNSNGEKMLDENREIDFAIKGEGELVFEELVQRMERNESFEGIKGLVYRQGDEVIENKGQQYFTDLDSLPFPARDLLSKLTEKTAFITSTRGCNARCNFCATNLIHGKFRMRSVKNVVNEIEYLYNDLKVKSIIFTDGSFEDSIDGSTNRLHEIAGEIIKRNLKISYSVFFRADFHKKADDELMNLLKKSGLCLVCVGVETGSEADLKLYNKHATLDDNYKITEFLRKHRIGYNTAFMNFNPYSTFETLEENINFLEKSGEACNFLTLLHKLDLYPGIPIYRKVKNDQQIVKIDDYRDYTFLDSRIFRLYYYLCRCFLDYDSMYGFAFRKINHYKFKFGGALTRGYEYAVELCDDEMLTVIDEIYEDRYKLLFQVSNHVAKWYRQLLDEVKTGVDKNRSDEFYYALLYNDSEFLNVVNEIESHMDKFYKCAGRKDYKEWYKFQLY